MATKRTGSRHLKRHMISLPDELYQQLRLAAEANGRPISWELRMRLEQSLATDQDRKGDRR